MINKIKIILEQLKSHAPFTLLGALLGVLFCLIFRNLNHDASHKLFEVFHPLHVFLSALATGAMYRKFMSNRQNSILNFASLVAIGLAGSIGVATLSDSIIPFFGEKLIGLEHIHLHVGFIESWYVVFPASFLGLLLAFWKPTFRSSHTAHVFISTWASLFHMMMALDGTLSPLLAFGLFVFLFLAVWLPCCLSDIAFPLLFLGRVEPCSHSHHH